MKTTSTKTIIQPFCPQLQRYEMRFSDGERYILRAFDSRCAEHLACAARLASGSSLECISFRRELSDEEITPRFLTLVPAPPEARKGRPVYAPLPELAARHLGERLLTTREAAALLKISEDAVLQRVRVGSLKSFKIGACRRYCLERHLAPHLQQIEASGREEAKS